MNTDREKPKTNHLAWLDTPSVEEQERRAIEVMSKRIKDNSKGANRIVKVCIRK